MSEDPSSDSGIVTRRDVLKSVGGVTASGVAFSTGASANPGNSRGQGNGRGPHLEPTDDNVVFCGCSQVCICDEFDCGGVTVILENGPQQRLDAPGCLEVEDDKILAIINFSDGGTKWCNPNTACADSDRKGCDEVGTAPQFGARCGEAFLREC